MTKTEMEDAIKTCNRQLSAIEQILPTLATKQDLERFACAAKKDLERFATKKDLERFATKEDLERFATKEDLRREISASETRTAVIIESLRDDIHKVAEGYAEHAVKLQALAVVADTVAFHTVQLDAIGTAVKTLTNRLEKKGVI